MRIQEILNEKQIEEISIKQAATAAALFGAAFGPHPLDIPNILDSNISVIGIQAQADEPSQEIEQGESTDRLTDAIVEKYNVDPNIISEIVRIADKYSYTDFPRTEDILSIIGIESSFNHMAKSKLRYDPAKGLMQVRPGIWKIPKSELRDIEGQIKHGVEILRKYYEKLKDDEASLRAYNLGITRYKKNPNDPRGDRYVEKFQKEKQLYASL